MWPNIEHEDHIRSNRVHKANFTTARQANCFEFVLQHILQKHNNTQYVDPTLYLKTYNELD